MRRVAAAVASAVVLASLPGVATAAAAAAPRLGGAVLDPAGRPPAVPLAVRVTEHQGFADVFGSLFVLALGGPAGVLACLGQSGICARPGETIVRVGRDGRFALTVPSGAGDYDVSVLTLTGSHPQPRLSLTVDVGDSGLTLPTLRLWSSAIKVRTDPGTVGFSWSPLPAGYSTTDVHYDLSAKPNRDNGFFGNPATTATSATVDDRQLEDTPGTAVAIARGRVGGRKVNWLTARVGYPAPAGRPLSRGRACTITVQRARPVRFASCWLDNGATQDSYSGSRGTVCYREKAHGSLPNDIECGPRAVAAVTIDLGATRRIGEVRGAGCERCLVDVSTDGITWSDPQATSDDSDRVIEFAEGTAGRYVRLRAAAPVVPSLEPEFEPTGPIVGRVPYDLTPNDLALQTELSVWGPRPLTPSPAVDSSTPPVASPPVLAKRARTDGVPVGAIVVASMLVAILLGGLGFVAGRRVGIRRG